MKRWNGALIIGEASSNLHPGNASNSKCLVELCGCGEMWWLVGWFPRWKSMGTNVKSIGFLNEAIYGLQKNRRWIWLRVFKYPTDMREPTARWRSNEIQNLVVWWHGSIWCFEILLIHGNGHPRNRMTIPIAAKQRSKWPLLGFFEPQPTYVKHCNSSLRITVARAILHLQTHIYAHTSHS